MIWSHPSQFNVIARRLLQVFVAAVSVLSEAQFMSYPGISSYRRIVMLKAGCSIVRAVHIHKLYDIISLELHVFALDFVVHGLGNEFAFIILVSS
jgi:hypothetical protein